MLTLDQLKKVFIPINTYNKPNNLKDASRGIQLYNDSVNFYDALQLVAATPSTPTDLSNTVDASNIYLNSSTGADTTLLPATTTEAGVMSAADKVRANALITLSGVAASSLNLGTFTGTIIPDNLTIKAALQSLETNIAAIPVIAAGNLVSASTPITVTSGTGAVIGAGTTLTFNPSLVLLSALGGSLTLSQLSVTGASSGQFLMFNGTNWATTTYTPPIQDHNTLTGKQGGATSQYYHLNQTVYDKLNSATASSVIGRGIGTGEVDIITATKSLIVTAGELRLINDSTSPGNNKYYGTDGSGVKGYFDASVFAGVTEVQVTDSVNIDFTVTNPTTTPNITADLIDTGITPSSYGSVTSVATFTVDAKGRLSVAATVPIAIPSTAITDFAEAVDDRVNSLLVAGTGITLVYNDIANTMTINGTATSSIDGTGAADRVAFWTDSNTLTFDNNLAFDGTYLSVGTATPSSAARLTTKGLGTSISTYGLVHQNSSGNEVFKVADDGSVSIGSLGEVFINKDFLNIATGGQYPISVVGELYMFSDEKVVIEGGGTATNLPSFQSIATRSTSIGNLYNAQITGTIQVAAGGTNAFTDLLIDTHIDQGLHTGIIRSQHIKPVVTSVNNYRGLDIDVQSSEHALYITSGKVRMDFPTNATGDIYYRNASGDMERLAVGTSMEVLGSNGTIPVWTTTAGSLPGGTNGDVLIYTGGSWVSGTPIKEKISGITGTGFNLAVTPLANMQILIFRNGLYQDDTDDYSIVGTSVTMVMALVSTDKITAIYYT